MTYNLSSFLFGGMMILDEKMIITVRWNTCEYYLSKGYDFPTYINEKGKLTVRKDTKIEIDQKDINPNSKTKIHISCDGCNKKMYLSACDYFSRLHNGEYFCRKCNRKFAKDTCLKKYGVENVSMVDDFKEKSKMTNLERYGVEYASSAQWFRDEVKNTNIEKYGVESQLMRKEIREKIEKTNMERYGCKNPLQNKDVYKKMSRTVLKKYGVSHISQLEKVKEKYKKTCQDRYGVDSVLQLESVRKCLIPTYSKQQLYICNLYNGILNYPIKKYNMDILYDDIDIEINFGGHNLQVKLGNMTQEEFDKREMVRDIIIKRNGYKVVKIISRKDKMPQDDVLLNMLRYMKNYFREYPKHTWIDFDIDNSVVINAENKEYNGDFYDYGKLYYLKNNMQTPLTKE